MEAISNPIDGRIYEGEEAAAVLHRMGFPTELGRVVSNHSAILVIDKDVDPLAARCPGDFPGGFADVLDSLDFFEDHNRRLERVSF